MESKVSVIIPAYNVEYYIEESINSLTNQSYKNIEIICIDDNSRDGTRDLIKKCQKKDSRIKLIINDNNRGPGYSRNRGIETATGKYVYFLDADDYILGNAFDVLVALAEYYNTECIFFDSIMKLESKMLGDRNMTYNLENIEKKILNGQELFVTMMSNNVFSSSVWRQFWRREFLLEKKLRFVEKLTSCEDAPFTVHAILRGDRMMVLNQALHVYRKHEGTLSTNLFCSKVMASFYAYCVLLKELLDDNYNESVKNALEKRCRQSLISVKRFYERNRLSICGKDFSEPFERHLFELIIEGKDHNFIEIDTSILDEINNYRYVIIYGEGRIAMDVLHTLRKVNIEVWGFAVTNKTEKDSDIEGIPIKEIQEYKIYKEKAIIILGVAVGNKKAVLSNLKRCGFEHYIDLINRNNYT